MAKSAPIGRISWPSRNL